MKLVLPPPHYQQQYSYNMLPEKSPYSAVLHETWREETYPTKNKKRPISLSTLERKEFIKPIGEGYLYALQSYLSFFFFSYRLGN